MDFGLNETPSFYCGYGLQDELGFPFDAPLFPQPPTSYGAPTYQQERSESEPEDRMIEEYSSNDDDEDEDFVEPNRGHDVVQRGASVKRRLFPEDVESNTEAPPKKKRGRPPSLVKNPDIKQKGRRKKKTAQPLSANTAATFPGGLWSVRSIPCFFVGCTYSYKRPGSAIVEVSDRPLILPEKFSGYSIRACKKHHDRWKVMDSRLHASRDPFCELCRNLNCKEIDNPDLARYKDISKEYRKFNLCSACANRQKKFIPLAPCSDDEVGESEPESCGYESLKDSPQKSPTCSPPPASWSSNLDSQIEEERDVPSSGKMKDVGEGSSCSLTVCRTSQPTTWNEVTGGMEYCTVPLLDESLPSHLLNADSGDVVFSQATSLFRFRLQAFEEEDDGIKYRAIGVFAEQAIRTGVCVGEFCGKVVKKKTSKKHPKRAVLLQNVMIDASKRANEIAFIRDVPVSISEAPNASELINIRFQVVGDRVIAITTRNIAEGEELIADYSDFRTRYNKYLEVFERIHRHNNEVLDEQENTLSSLKWFMNEGFSKLRKKHKIHVPKACRLPPKRGNTSSKKHMRVLGYVAQMLALDMDRAKENSWTCFVPTNKIDYESMNLAIKRWKKSHPEYAKTEAFEALKNSPVQESPNRPPELHQLKQQTPSDMIIDEPVKSNSAFATAKMECKNLNTIPSEDIEIKSDSLRNGFVLQSEWKGYPVVIRYPQIKETDPKQKEAFVQACNISAINHPNLVTCYGVTNKDGRIGMVTEYMNLGNLKQWCSVTSYPVQALYIPRVCMDIARGMYEIHNRGLVHGNLRSTNVLVKGDNSTGFVANMETKISDLVTVLYNQEIKVTPDTVKYLAPELFTTKQFSKASDVYAYGVLLCILFSGRTEETIARPMEIITNPAFVQSWGMKWQNLLRRCVDRNPSNRPSFGDILAITQSLTREAEGIPEY